MSEDDVALALERARVVQRNVFVALFFGFLISVTAQLVGIALRSKGPLGRRELEPEAAAVSTERKP